MESLRIRNEAGVMYAAMKVVQCMVGSKDHEVGENIHNSNNYISKIVTTTKKVVETIQWSLI